MASVDVSRTLAFAGSSWRMLGLGVLGILMTGLSGVLAGGLLPGTENDWLARANGWLGLAFFGLATMLVLWRAITETGPVVTLTPTGITDTRIAAREVPWTAVHGISTWDYKGQQVMVLAVDPDIEAQLELSRIARMTRTANAALGADGLCVTAQGLKVAYDDLLAATRTYLTAHGRG